MSYKIISRVTRNYEGWLIGFRRWELRAYDEEGSLIHEITQWEDNNYLKYIKFLKGLREKGYDLKEEDRRYLKTEPFLLKSFIPQIQRHHVIQLAELVGYNEDFLNNIKNETDEIKYKFAYDIGLEKDEIDYAINNFA